MVATFKWVEYFSTHSLNGPATADNRRIQSLLDDDDDDDLPEGKESDAL